MTVGTDEAAAPAPRLQVLPVVGIPEVRSGDDVAALVVRACGADLRDGDVVVVTSKIVSKAAGLVVHGSRESLVAAQTDRVVATRGQTQIVRTHHGLTMAAAGVDASNTPPGTAVPLPADPDKDARSLRRALLDLVGRQVAVVVSDTAGRAWRDGQTDIAIGVAGLVPVLSLSGRPDAHGNPLVVTAPALADEVAGAADLVQGKASQVPVAIVRGAPAAWLTDEDGPGAVALVREEDADLFGYGAVEAVRAAVLRSPGAARGFPAPERGGLQRAVDDARTGVDEALVDIAMTGPYEVAVRPRSASADAWLAAGAVAERLRVLDAAGRCGATITVAHT